MVRTKQNLFLHSTEGTLICPYLSGKSSAMQQHQLQTQLIHATVDGEKTSDVREPIHLSTTFVRPDDGLPGPMVYSRLDNPNRLNLEKKLALLEKAAEALSFASGQAATLAVFQAVLEPGAQLLIPDDCYHGTRALLQLVLNQWQITWDEVDMSNLEQVAAAIRPNTRLIWLETPSNPLLKICDISAIAQLTQGKEILLACDNTWATSLVQQPLDLGADLVMHSTTKYLGGHSDVLGGALMHRLSGPIAEKLRNIQRLGGAVPSPFDCWLLSRSLATFPMRMQVHQQNASALAEYLDQHPKIEKVYFPGLSSHPGHAIAKAQMQGGFGGMLSIEVKGDQQKTLKLASSLRIFAHATSLGGVESLIEHRRSVEGTNPKSPENLLRVSVGIEAIADLIADFEQAFQLI
jgi:cystathionine gamma-synthase